LPAPADVVFPVSSQHYPEAIMVRLSQFDESERQHLLNLPCPTFATTPFVAGPPLVDARVALISTAGLHRRQDRPFAVGESGYRLIPREVKANELIMSHISTNFDRTGFQQDLNMVFPLDRLQELAEAGVIAGVADYHYSFMGATDPAEMAAEAGNLAKILAKDRVNAVLLVPV
jgi:D-proline reductase (dithiol) PrdB